MGHPAAALVWLAEALAARGECIEAGAIVLSGGLTASVPLQPRGVVTAEFDGLGSIGVHCAMTRTGVASMAEVTILPDGVRVTARRRTRRCCGRWAGPGCGTGSAASAAVAGSARSSSCSGEVRYERPIADSVLTDDERVEGICLSCRAVPITNIVIELQEGDRLRTGPRVRLPELQRSHPGRSATGPRSEEGRKGKSNG